ncbi:MFS transporter [Salinisphaera sp. T31B1]
MGRVVVSLAAMFVSLALFIAGTALLTTVLSLELVREGYSALVVGVVLVCHSIGFVLGSFFSTRLIVRVGQVRSFSAFAAVGCAAALIHPMWVDAVLWAVLRGLVGFCAAGLIMVLESWISARATNATRGALLGIYQVVYFFAAALGQYLVSFDTAEAYTIYSVVAILVVLSLVPLALTRAEAPQVTAAEHLGFVALYRLSPSGLFGGVAGGMIVSCFLALGPVYASRIGMSIPQISYYMAMAVLATMVLQWPVGRLSDRFDRRWVIALSSAVAAGGAALGIGLGEIAEWVVYIATALLFGLAGCLYPLSLAMINDNMDAGDPVRASAGLLLAYGAGTCLGPVGGALTMQWIGPAGLFGFTGGLFALYTALVVWRGFTTQALPVEQQGRFVGIVATQTAPALLDMDPRAEPFDAAHGVEISDTTDSTDTASA